MSRSRPLSVPVPALFVVLGLASCSSEDKPAAKEPEAKFPEMVGVTFAADENPDPHVVEVSLTAQRAKKDIGGKEVVMMTYNGEAPGPVIRAHVGDEVIVHFDNLLDEPTTIHWHGLRIPDAMDGSPRIQDPVPAKGIYTYRFKVPEAGSFWYHPHVRPFDQIERGLYGMFVVYGKDDPAYDAERYLALDDLRLVNSSVAPPDFSTFPEMMHGRYGDMLITNGQKAELAKGESKRGKVERWRLVNTANARTQRLGIEGAKWRIIGTDGGLLNTPYTPKEIVLPVGQRYDVEVSYDTVGTVKLLSSIAVADGADKVKYVPTQVFAVDVAEGTEAPREIAWPELPVREKRVADAALSLSFNAIQTSDGMVEWQVNGKAHSMDAVGTYKVGQTVKIKLENKLGPEHPFHLHGQFFEILNKPEYPGLKDTVLIPGMETVEVLAYMDNPGRWMAHCHILEHAELGLMSEIVVEGEPGQVSPGLPDHGHGQH